jgi:hypothetical protein
MRWIMVLTIFAFASGCGEDDEPASTPEPTGTAIAAPAGPLPFTVSQPVDATAALTEERLDGRWFIIDLESGLVQVLKDSYVNPCPTVDPTGRNCVSHGGIISVDWHDAETLVVSPMYGEALLIRLDGTSRSAPPVNTATPDSSDNRSRDKEWRASTVAVELGVFTVIVSQLREVPGGMQLDPAYRITSASIPQWSPADPHLLALTVNYCTDQSPDLGLDLALFDPETAVLRDLSIDPARIIRSYVWRPDGRAIAAEAFVTGPGFPYAELELIDVATGSTLGLAALGRGGTLVPMSWSPDREKLLFRFSAPGVGGLLCERGGGSQSEVERLK